MTEKQPAQIANQKSQIENDAGLWSELRQSMERLAAAGHQKSDPAALAKRLAARAKLLRGRMTETSAESPLVFLAFNMGAQRYGIPVNDVLEVQELDHFSPVPATPSFILGVVHWRGAILSLLDLGRLFEIPESGITDIHSCVIVEAAGRRVAVVSHDIEEIFAVPRSDVKSAPELPGNLPPEWVVGVHDDNRLILRTDLILQDTRLVEWRK